VDLISSYIPVKRAGSAFKACCPFHNEKTPSFHINASHQRFKCFGCGEGGDALTFVMKYEGLPFVEAIKKLAQRAGIPIIEEAYDADAERGKRKRGRLLDLHREVTAFLHQLLIEADEAKHARNYLAKRGYKRDMAERWHVGWMPKDSATFLNWAREKKFTGRELVDSGICIERENSRGLYNRFRDRLMFPIRNDQGDVIAFSGRQIIHDPNSGKYINSPETALFTKSKVLFAFDRARRPITQRKSVLICEGQLDALACHEQGIDNAIATLGTACTPQHAKILKRYTDTAHLCFDADKAGYDAAVKAFRTLSAENINIRVISMPPGDDPDSFLKRDGPEAFRQLLDDARPFFDFQIDRARAVGGLAHAQARANTSREIADLLACIEDNVNRDSMLNHCATLLQISTPELRQATSLARKKHLRDQKNDTRRGSNAAETPAAATPTPADITLLYLANLALRSSPVKEFLCEQFEFFHEAARYLEGIPLLDNILAGDYDPSQPASVNTYLANLAENDRLALQSDSTFAQETTEPTLDAAQSALSLLAEKVLNKRHAINLTSLSQPGLTAEQYKPLLEEAQEIQRLQSTLGRRSIADDRASLGVTARRPKPTTNKFPRKPSS
jgi:DNA primase